MKNVIVFALDQHVLAVELRWVREMFTLGYVTPIPSAPPLVDGVANLRGTITPIIDLTAIINADDGVPQPMTRSVLPTARRGDGAILLEVEALIAAVRISNVEEVSTLTEGGAPDVLRDSRGRDVRLIDPRRIMERALSACDDARGIQPGLMEAVHGR